MDQNASHKLAPSLRYIRSTLASLESMENVWHNVCTACCHRIVEFHLRHGNMSSMHSARETTPILLILKSLYIFEHGRLQ